MNEYISQILDNVARNPKYIVLGVTSSLPAVYFACMGVVWAMIKRDRLRIELQDEPSDGDGDATLSALHECTEEGRGFLGNTASRNTHAIGVLGLHATVFLGVAGFMTFIYLYFGMWSLSDAAVAVASIVACYMFIFARLWLVSQTNIVVQTGYYLFAASCVVLLWTVVFVVDSTPNVIK